MANDSSIFLQLPLEMREEIYRHLLVFQDDIEIQFHISQSYQGLKVVRGDPDAITLQNDSKGDVIPKRTSILCVSRQISEEALNILYKCNTFLININSFAPITSCDLRITNAWRIRSLRFVAQPKARFFAVFFIWNTHAWVPLLTDLAQLSLVLQQPSRHQFCMGFKDDVRTWVEWLNPVLQYLASNIPERTIVSVDDNEQFETGEVVQKFFGPGHRKHRTEIGDRLFRRV